MALNGTKKHTKKPPHRLQGLVEGGVLFYIANNYNSCKLLIFSDKYSHCENK